MIERDLTCQELVELVTDYFEGTLPPHKRARFELHLIGCGYCRLYLDQMRMTIDLAGTPTEAAVPPAARDELLKVFRGWKRSD
jgi:hypothetical protein